MSNIDNNLISNILTLVLILMIVILVVLVLTYIILKVKSKSKENKENLKNAGEKEIKSTNTNATNGYGKQSILNFMEFDDIMDNMIVQKNGRRYVMVMECQGVNYDLMSKVEKVGVEEGFQQFLNTLRHSIQIYIQTRTVNLENSINNYKSRVNSIESKYNRMLNEYKQMAESEDFTEEELNKYNFEIIKQKNLLDYGKDIIANTERMSKNKNVLSKKYYIALHYFPEEVGNEKLDKEEIRSIAFSELYTKMQAMIATLSACSVQGRILDSIELAELLYMGYNRDEAEIYGVEKMIRAGNLEMYSMAPDVYLKKIEMLNEKIQESAIDLANDKIEKAKSYLQKTAEERERKEKELIEEVAKAMIRGNEDYIGYDIADEAIRKIEEGGNADEKIKKARRRKKRTAE